MAADHIDGGTTEFTQIRYEVADNIATITLDRPNKLNAFTETMRLELISAFDLTDADDAVKAVIVTGEGEAFCAGADLSGGASTFAQGGSGEQTAAGVPRDGGGTVALRIFDSIKPVIGAINGAAVGVGVTMTLPFDIRIASPTARFGFVFNRRGIIPEACSSWFLPRIVGISKALELSYSGRVFNASEALECGLIRSIHPREGLMAAARALANDVISHSAPVSIALTRQMMWRMLGSTHPMDAHQADSRALLSRGRSDDGYEGIVSFLEKRPAEFRDSVANDMPDIFPNWVEPEFE